MKLKVNTCDETYCPVIINRARVAEAVIQKLAETESTESKVTEAESVVAVEKSVGVAPVLLLTERAESLMEKPEVAKTEPTVLTEVIENEKTAKPRRRSLWRSRVGAIAVAIVAVIAVTLVGLRLAGFRTFTVMSGSMDPEYPVGSLIYVKPVDYQSLKVGDVIAYVAGDDKTIVPHRIAEIEVDETDTSVWRFKTKGDANSAADGKLVHYKNVLGTPIIMIPFIGYVAHNIQQPPGIYIALVVGTLLLAWTFLPGTLEERRKTARKSVA